MPATAKRTLGKKERLKSRKRIERVFAEGKRVTRFPYKVVYLFGTGPAPLQAGFGVNAKQFRRAVARNRIRRMVREAYRLQKNELQNALLENNSSLAVFFIYTGKEMPAYEEIYRQMTAILKKLKEDIPRPGKESGS